MASTNSSAFSSVRQWAHRLAGVALLAGAFMSTGTLSAKEQAATPAPSVNKTEELQASAEIEGRRVILPPDLQMDLEWYAPVVNPAEAGKIIRGWVKEDLILLETDKNNLIAVRREDGTERWRAVLSEPIRYEPAVSRSNVVVNERNMLLGIERNSGDLRWKLNVEFPMSHAPVVIDPPAYPKEYKRDWQNMEYLYLGDWRGRFHAEFVRGHLAEYVKEFNQTRELSAPAFDLFPNWHYTLPGQGAVTFTPRIMDDTFYFAGDDKYVYAVNRDRKVIDPYILQGVPCTPVTVTSNNVYVGSRDYYVYALDRLSMKKKWNYGVGSRPKGTIFADEPSAASIVCIPTETDGIHAIRVMKAGNGEKIENKVTGEKKADYTPEHWDAAWKFPAQGVITAGSEYIYVGNGVTEGFNAYAKVIAVRKDNGKAAWSSDSAGVRFYLEYHNAWKRKDSQPRLYAVTEDNRILSFREKKVDAGPLSEKKASTGPAMSETPEGEMIKVPGKGPKKADAPAGDAPKADAPKADAPKADAPKAETK